jgi:hypothetical protein
VSLTDQENFKRTWGRFPKLWSMLENQPISDTYIGLSSIDENFFSYFERVYSVVIKYLSATDRYVSASQDPTKDISDYEQRQRVEIFMEIDQLSEELAVAASQLKKISEEVQVRKVLAHYLFFSGQATQQRQAD